MNASRTVIRPSSVLRPLHVGELWSYRDLLRVLAGRDLKLRYRQTVLGVLWVIAQPLVGALVFTLVFGRVAQLPSAGIPYLPFAYAGLLGWNLFASGFTKASAAMVLNANLVSKVYFPRILLPLSTFGSTLVDFLVGLAFFVGLAVFYGLGLRSGLALLPLWLALLVALSAGLGLVAGAWSVLYRDVQLLVPLLLPFLLYASPVAYSVDAVPGRYRWIYTYNPLTAPLEGFRYSLLGVGMPNWSAVVYSAACAVAIVVAGAYTFRSMERTFADVI